MPGFVWGIVVAFVFSLFLLVEVDVVVDFFFFWRSRVFLDVDDG